MSSSKSAKKPKLMHLGPSHNSSPISMCKVKTIARRAGRHNMVTQRANTRMGSKKDEDTNKGQVAKKGEDYVYKRKRESSLSVEQTWVKKGNDDSLGKEVSKKVQLKGTSNNPVPSESAAAATQPHQQHDST